MNSGRLCAGMRNAALYSLGVLITCFISDSVESVMDKKTNGKRERKKRTKNKTKIKEEIQKKRKINRSYVITSGRMFGA